MDPRLADLPTSDLASAYNRRGLDQVDDDQLVAAVAAVVAEPRQGPADSFVLHAPLELVTRARVLARTPADLRRLARLRLVSIAARYQTYPAAERARPAGGGVRAVIDAMAAGDPVRAEAAAADLAERARHRQPGDLDPIIDALAAAVADRSAAAAHGPILLATLTEVPDRARAWIGLARPLVRELARHPDWRLTWITRAAAAHAPAGGGDRGTVPPDDPLGLFAALADPPRLGRPEPAFIHPMLMQVDAPGVADAVLGPVAGPGRRVTPDARRAVTRAAALAMVRDDPAAAPYGWTHCLTLPQAVLTLAPRLEALGVDALAVAATDALAFRAAHGTTILDRDDPLLVPAEPATVDARRRDLTAEIARRHDAHIAKYLVAVMNEAEHDPECGHLYLSAGEHLLDVWDQLGPDPDDLLADEVSGPGRAA